MKKCGRCKQEKPISEFNNDRTMKDGLTRRCKACTKEVHTNWYNQDPERAREKWRKAGKIYDWRKLRWKKKFGITRQEYERMLELQEGVCGICKEKPSDLMLAVDHDHESGKVRGLLCSDCNFGLGRFKDNAKVLQSAIEYLQRVEGEVSL